MWLAESPRIFPVSPGLHLFSRLPAFRELSVEPADHVGLSRGPVQEGSPEKMAPAHQGSLSSSFRRRCACPLAHSGALSVQLIDLFGRDLSQFLFPGLLPAEEMILGSHPSALVAREERISLFCGSGPTARTPVLRRLILFCVVSLPAAETVYILVLEVIKLDKRRGGGGGPPADLGCSCRLCVPKMLLLDT